jgi:hypothetical protein
MSTSSYNPPTVENINTDLLEKPMWILSSYGPGKNPPVQLIDGKDISFEEARVLAYQCQAEGNPVVYVRHAAFCPVDPFIRFIELTSSFREGTTMD